MSRAGIRVPRITELQVIALLKSGRYKVNRNTAIVIGPKGKRVTPVDIGRNGRLYVRVYGFGGVRTITRARLVWLSVTLEPLPGKHWEVHHRDENNGNDTWANLIALHRLDHRKCHYDTCETPF